MACPDPADAVELEQAVLAVLDGTATSTIDGDVLRLVNGSAGLDLPRSAPEGGTAPDGLEGTPWLLDSIVAGSTTTAIAEGVRRPTLEFDGESVAVFTGCNNGSGSYTVDGDQIAFGPIAMTDDGVRGRDRRRRAGGARRARRHGDGARSPTAC